MKVKIGDEWKEYEVEFGRKHEYGRVEIIDRCGTLTDDLSVEAGCLMSKLYGVVDPCEDWQCLIAVSDEEWLDKTYGENEFAFETEYTIDEILHMDEELHSVKSMV